MPNLPQNQVHLGLWLYLVCMSLLTRMAHLPPEEWIGKLFSTNLIAILAFLAIFHLLTTTQNKALATASDYRLIVVAMGFSMLSSFVGMTYDIPFIMGGIALYYFYQAARIPDGIFLGIVYFALMINGFLAPVVFQIFKPFFLNGEVQLVASLGNQFGLNIVTDGTLMHANNDVKLLMVGACSAFMNVSFAFLGYAAIKGFLRSQPGWYDWIILAVLLIAIVFGNSFRIGLMALSRASYEYWHHGDGAVIFGIVQLAAIATISLLPFMSWRRT